jgi:hypothetical protein
MTTYLAKALNRKSKLFTMEEIPEKYVRGTGHVKFFLDKFHFLKDRQESLIRECQDRGINVKFTDASFLAEVPYEFFNWYEPTKEEIELSRTWINEKIAEKPDWYRKTPHIVRYKSVEFQPPFEFKSLDNPAPGKNGLVSMDNMFASMFCPIIHKSLFDSDFRPSILDLVKRDDFTGNVYSVPIRVDN